MRFKIFAFIWFAALAAAPITLSADDGCCSEPAAACCDSPAMACCDTPAAKCCDKGDTHSCAMNDGAGCDMPCCKGEAVQSAVDVLIAMDGQAILPGRHEAPRRQTAVVWFHRPVWVGQTVLIGKHVIEHDTDRQAKGEPCTHIYAANDLKTPVATFHCTHLEGERASKDVVVLKPVGDGQRKLLQFQFAGETAAHGYPTGR